ncbi:hypothetical protein CVT25_007498 [Psilocybe cyanescens]|uniref:Uncharacterized protein n=1 Tax=Psilocybe cyanescens TaxID=93625 RepID=A0A409WAM7_PSICY|nr:hypothetical protein CVT25_007498 [Psilocybe cyanescens]
MNAWSLTRIPIETENYQTTFETAGGGSPTRKNGRPISGGCGLQKDTPMLRTCTITVTCFIYAKKEKNFQKSSGRDEKAPAPCIIINPNSDSPTW